MAFLILVTPNIVGEYPEFVDTAALRTAWDTSTTAGLTGILTLTPGANPGSLPGGSGTLSGSTISIPNSGTSNYTNWDFTGYHLVADSTETAVFTNCKFAGTNSAYLTVSSANSNITLTNCEVDGTGRLNSSDGQQEGGLRFTAGTINISATKFTRDDQDFISAFSATGALQPTLTISECWVGPCGYRGPGSHIEPFHLCEGNFTLERCLFDQTTAPTDSTWTGLLAMNPGFVFNSNPAFHSSVVNDCIFIGAAHVNSNHAIQIFEQNGVEATSEWNRNLVEGGTSASGTGPAGYIAETNGTPTTTGSGNRIYATGVGITLP